MHAHPRHLWFPLLAPFSTCHPFTIQRIRSKFLSSAMTLVRDAKEDASAYNCFASSVVDLSNAHVSHSGLLTLTRSVRDIDGQKRRKYLYTIPVKGSMGSLQIPPHEIHDNIQFRLPSPSGGVVGILRNESNNGKNTPILEVWKQGGQTLERRINLVREGYGKIISDASGGFGMPSWNARENVIVYSMERLPQESKSFFDSSQCDNTKKSLSVGGQNELGVGKLEHWGEKYSNQSPLTDLFCVNVDTGKFDRVDNVPYGDSSEPSHGGYAFGQAVFHPADGQSIVYTGWDAGGGKEMPRRLGLVYCQQRPCKLYLSSVSNLLQKLAVVDHKVGSMALKENITGSDVKCDVPYIVLTPNYRIAQSPRFAQDGKPKLVFLTSEKGFDTHSGCFSLGLMEIDVESICAGGDPSFEPRILLDQVWDAAMSSSSLSEVGGLRFPGLYMSQLPVHCFISSDILLLSTNWGSCVKTVLVSLEEGAVQLLRIEGNDALSSDELLYAAPGYVVINSKTPGHPGLLHVISSERLRDTNQVQAVLTLSLPSIASSAVSTVPSSLRNNFTYSLQISEATTLDGVDCNHSIQSILLLPQDNSDSKPPLIVIPHGGPHSVSSTSFVPSYAYLCGYGGYALLLVNYRGSTGFGQSSIEALPTNIGTMDIQDVMSATKAVKESGLVDSDRIFACGGSHGGFLVAHGTSQHPDFFRAAVMRNPVVNIASMVTTTDIPDWCHVEAIGSYNWKEYRPPSLDEMVSFYEKSPIQHIDQVRTPTLVALGMKDLRVPPSQGLEWYHTLRSMGVPTKLLLYETDDHAIDSAAAEADHWVNIKRWFDQYR